MDNSITSDQTFDVPQILDVIRQKTSAVASVDLGYPLGENVVHPPSTAVETLSFLSPRSPNYRPVRTFYELSDGISLPDIGNGVFVHRRALVATNAKRGVPVALREGGSILVFGSDGGGGMFAVSKELGSQVIHLPVGAVADGVFDNVHYPGTIVSRSFAEFLSRIVADMDAFIEGRPDWRFIA